MNDATIHEAADLDALVAAITDNIARLHCRYRFDAAGLPASERAHLRTLAQQWLERRPRFNAGSRA